MGKKWAILRENMKKRVFFGHFLMRNTPLNPPKIGQKGGSEPGFIVGFVDLGPHFCSRSRLEDLIYTACRR